MKRIEKLPLRRAAAVIAAKLSRYVSGACEPECPVNAIFPEESLPPEWAQYLQINAVWFTDKAAARAEVDAIKPA